MQKGTIRSINASSKYPSLWLLAVAICLCAGAAQAQTGNTAYGTGALTNMTSGSYNTADVSCPDRVVR